MSKTTALWRGRLASSMLPEARDFISSFSEDASLIDIDCDVTQAHALALGTAGIFKRHELVRVIRALERARGAARAALRRRAGAGPFHDIHPLIEKIVLKSCGENVGGRIHLGKSRNDQVAADIIIHVRRGLLEIAANTAELVRALLSFSRRFGSAVFPAYTHMRAAQPITAGHFFLAYAQALVRDADRILAARARMNFSPLGACAVAGTAVPVSRAHTARLLGFKGVWEHSLDATGARDHLLEALAALTIMQNTLSRLAGDVIFMCSDEVGLLDYPDELADTSSAMPHKKNPDPLELVRARAAVLAGEAAGACAITHGLPAGYSRDLQDLKPALWRALTLSGNSVGVMALLVPRLEVNRDRALEILKCGHTMALDLAESLSLFFGVPFRRAHFAVGKLVRKLVSERRTLQEITADEASAILSRHAGRKIEFSGKAWERTVDPEEAVRRRRAGGPGSIRRLRRGVETGRRLLVRGISGLERAEDAARRSLRSAVKRHLG